MKLTSLHLMAVKTQESESYNVIHDLLSYICTAYTQLHMTHLPR